MYPTTWLYLYAVTTYYGERGVMYYVELNDDSLRNRYTTSSYYLLPSAYLLLLSPLGHLKSPRHVR